MTFKLRFITYTGVYRNVEAESINLPTPDGRRGILPNHMPILLPVNIGIINTVENGTRKNYAVSQGTFYFENNTGTLVADIVEDVSEIDIESAKSAQRKAEERVHKAQNEAELLRARIALENAINRIKAVQKD